MDLIDTILFDWDGTLIDTALPSFYAFQKAMDASGIAIGIDLYEEIYAPNWYNMYERLGLPEKKWQEADNLWLRHYGEIIPEPVEGGMRVLDELCRRGYGLGVVTSGSRMRVRREINALGLEDTFRVVVCNEDVRNKKPDPEGIKRALKSMDKSPEVSCYVGDSPDDVEMGKRARIRTIGILSKYPNSRKLRSAEPDFCFESIMQLLPLFCNDSQGESAGHS
jgi:HAD superfamily hydrolase (TIGR01509 family)